MEIENKAIRTAIGIGITAIAQEHIFTFLLSSAFTGRNIVKEKGDIQKVREDVLWALGLSIAFTILIYTILRDFYTLLFGCIFAGILYYIYMSRAELW